MISGNLRMEIGMDIGSKSKLAICHNNLKNRWKMGVENS